MKKRIPWGEFAFLGMILCYVGYYFFSVKGYASKAVLWPYCLMAACVVAVVAVAVELLQKAPEREDTAPEQISVGAWIKAKSPIFVVIAAFVLYALLLKKLGLHLCNFLISFGLVLYLSKRKWRTALVAAVLITLAFYLVFDLALGLRLPKCKLF